MKYSKYNVVHRLDSSGYILSNTLYASDAFLSDDEYAFFSMCLSKTDVPTTEPEYTELVKQKFLIDDDTDELAGLIIANKSAVYNIEPKYRKYVLVPTMDCNARCYYCYEAHDGRSRVHSMSQEVMDATIDFIIRHQGSASSLNISWFGGEPLMDIKCITYISEQLQAFCTANRIDYHAHITTNGSLISEDTVTLFNRLKITNVQITLDGLGAEYERVKNYSDIQNTFTRITDNIFILANAGITVSIRLNVGRNNIDEIKHTVAWLINDSRFNQNIDLFFYPLFYCDTGSSSNNCSEFLNEYEYETILSDLYLLLFEKNFFASPTQLHCKSKGVFCYCYDLISYAIDPNGNLFNCQHALGVNNEVLGNVLSKELITYEYACQHDMRIDSECVDCKYIPICQGGCFLSRLYKSSIGRCSIEKYKFTARQELLGKMLLSENI